MITDVEVGIDNSCWLAKRYTKVYHDGPLGGEGTPELILKALAKLIGEDIKRREKQKAIDTAKAEIYKATLAICSEHGVTLKVEVSDAER